MFASLPMYDRPETAAAHDALWLRIRDRMRDRGVDAPDALDRSVHHVEGWGRADLVLDGMLGTGGRGGLRGDAVELTRAAAEEAAITVAVDVPSGIDASTGAVEGVDAVLAGLVLLAGIARTVMRGTSRIDEIEDIEAVTAAHAAGEHVDRG